MGEKLSVSLCYRAQCIKVWAPRREATVGSQAAGRATMSLGAVEPEVYQHSPAKMHFRQEPSISEENRKGIKHRGLNMIGALMM